jgi:hypothetical protein
MITKRKVVQKIPGAKEWAGYKDDLDASHEIYGDFIEKAAKLKELCGRVHSQQDPEDQMLDPTDDA